MTQAIQDAAKFSSSGKLMPYDDWMEAQGVPIYRGYYIEDLRTVPLGWWEERKCNTAFIQFEGMQGINEARVSEIQPGESLPAMKFALDEIVYVLDGRGLTTVWHDSGPKKTFEWQAHSMFLLPKGHHHQLSSTRGDKPVRLLHYNYLPVAMSAIPDYNFFINNQYVGEVAGQLDDLFAEAKAVPGDVGLMGPRNVWYGNFFPDMRAWDKLDAFRNRGAGGHVVFIQFAGSMQWAHMSVFPARTYKKAHRHGPGRAIIIPGGEGFSVMWNEGEEKVVIPWHEGSLFTPPNRWFHQHFNVGGAPGRYLAMHPLPQFAGHSEKVEDQARDQIEYPDEEPWIRQKFESELAQRGITSMMPEQAYQDHGYQWKYEGD